MQITNVLKQVDIFFDFTPMELELVAALCEERRCRAGEIIFAEGTPSDELYVIVRGEVEILLDPALVGQTAERGAQPAPIATLRDGQIFGEIALVDQGVRSATARALHSDTHLLRIQHDKLMVLCDAYAQLGYKLMRNLAADLALKIRNTDIEVRARLSFRAR
jgi:CRP/FNR family cyclic AMP-dependent transcriptional regulator